MNPVIEARRLEPIVVFVRFANPLTPRVFWISVQNQKLRSLNKAWHIPKLYRNG